MFLKKITAIKNVGRFKDASISGGEYKKYTLFYGGNARGKTTLCAVLRSLQRNDPKFILERQTFKSTNAPEVVLLLDSGITKFLGGKWSSSQPDIHLFDQHFINENVHSGNRVDLEHRRSFYHIAIGQEGVALAKKINELNVDIANKQKLIKNEERVIQQHAPQSMKFEVFLSQVDSPDIETQIILAHKNLKIAENSTEISQRSQLKTITLPCLPDNFQTTIEKTLHDVSQEATKLVHTQLDKHEFHGDGEQWLNEGLKHITDTECPFCGNNIGANQLIKAYQAYFSDAYATLKSELLNLNEITKRVLSEVAIHAAIQTFKDTVQDAIFWKSYAKIDLVFPDILPQLEENLQTLSNVSLAMIKTKIDAPLEPPTKSTELAVVVSKLATASDELAVCNKAILNANLIIQEMKEGNAKNDKARMEAEIVNLKAIKIRYAEPVLGLIKNYQSLVKEKDDLVKERDKIKDDLDAYDKRVLGDYEDDINEFLEIFGASFRLINSTKNYLGLAPQAVYGIKFDEGSVDITADGKDGNPCFETTMSAGDKNTLALAFFLANVMRDNDISRKIVVFDDPYSSLDDFRREVTANKIIHVGTHAAQVLVFSHDKYFLDAIWKKIYDAQHLTMQISCMRSNSAIECWDIEREIKEGYLQDHMALLEFVEGKTIDARKMRHLFRPLLEKYIRYRFPNQIPEGIWLGDMLGIIRNNLKHPLEPIYKELNDINDYSKTFHHDPNANFHSDEIMTFAKRTLKIVGGWN